jgi:hypothetical protein
VTHLQPLRLQTSLYYALLFAVRYSELFMGRRSKPGVPGLLVEKPSPRGRGDLFTLAIDSRSKYDFSPFLPYSETLIGGGRRELLMLPVSPIL